MFKYTVGQRVTIKSFDELVDYYGFATDDDEAEECIDIPFDWVPGMRRYCGRDMTINEVVDDGWEGNGYRFEGCDYCWHEGAIVSFFGTNRLVKGDVY